MLTSLLGKQNMGCLVEVRINVIIRSGTIVDKSRDTCISNRQHVTQEEAVT